ncbi:hypothetical protein K8942_02270 [Candidatus Peribacteria bacterium]|nr:MAG: hypothetical protein K8942_02270 [Candidatus Peribacteria bacterium]
MTSTTKNPPALTGEEMYDMIMERIEPDLTTKMLPQLDALYSYETPEQRAAREEWYTKVFAQFEIEYARFANGMKNYYTNIRKKALSMVRAVKEDAEKVSTTSIEESIQNS